MGFGLLFILCKNSFAISVLMGHEFSKIGEKVLQLIHADVATKELLANLLHIRITGLRPIYVTLHFLQLTDDAHILVAFSESLTDTLLVLIGHLGFIHDLFGFLKDVLDYGFVIAILYTISKTNEVFMDVAVVAGILGILRDIGDVRHHEVHLFGLATLELEMAIFTIESTQCLKQLSCLSNLLRVHIGNIPISKSSS